MPVKNSQSFAHFPSCEKVRKFLLQGFAGSSHSFGWLLTLGFQHYSYSGAVWNFTENFCYLLLLSFV